MCSTEQGFWHTPTPQEAQNISIKELFGNKEARDINTTMLLTTRKYASMLNDIFEKHSSDPFWPTCDTINDKYFKRYITFGILQPILRRRAP